MKNNWVELAVRWFLGMTFIYSSYHKIIDPAHFAKIVYGYYLFPDIFINLIAIVLPFLELFSGAALVMGIYPRSAVLLILGMLLTFIVAISINLLRGVEFDCGCFSFGEPGYTLSAGQLLIRDMIYFVMGLHVLLFDQRRKICLKQSGGLLTTISRPDRISA